MVDVIAEDDGLGESVCSFEEFSNLLGDELGTPFEDEVAVVVGEVVLAVLNELVVLVRLAFFWSPTFQVCIDTDTDDFVGREEAVGDSLPK